MFWRVIRRTMFAALVVLAVCLAFLVAILLWYGEIFSHLFVDIVFLLWWEPRLLIVPAVLLAACFAGILRRERRRRPIVIAVDGTAASGKGTLAKRLAAHFGFAHLDSGSLYRLVALTVLEAGGDPANTSDAVKAARGLDPARRNDPALRTEDIGQAAAKVAKMTRVRELVHRFQVSFIAYPPGGEPGSVVDGRDIGTVIAPHATAKLYVDARPEIRAHRRWLELQRRGIARDEGEILEEILARDAADMSRAVSPLKRADDAALLDTSGMDIDAAFAAALALVSPAVENVLKTHAKG